MLASICRPYGARPAWTQRPDTTKQIRVNRLSAYTRCFITISSLIRLTRSGLTFSSALPNLNTQLTRVLSSTFLALILRTYIRALCLLRYKRYLGQSLIICLISSILIKSAFGLTWTKRLFIRSNASYNRTWSWTSLL